MFDDATPEEYYSNYNKSAEDLAAEKQARKAAYLKSFHAASKAKTDARNKSEGVTE